MPRIATIENGCLGDVNRLHEALFLSKDGKYTVVGYRQVICDDEGSHFTWGEEVDWRIPVSEQEAEAFLDGEEIIYQMMYWRSDDPRLAVMGAP